MPISKSAIKEVRKTKKRHITNKALITRIKTMTKKIIAITKPEEAKKLYASFIPEVQRAVRKNCIHKNKGARIISRLTKHINSLKA